MKTRCQLSVLEKFTLCVGHLTLFILAFAATVFVQSASAEQLNPNGSHSEARLEKGVIVGNNLSANQPSSVSKVKTWVREKISTIASLWKGKNSADSNSGKKPTVELTAPAIETAKQLPPAQAPTVRVPASLPLAKTLQAPAAVPKESQLQIDVPGLRLSNSGVARYDISTSVKIPVLRLNREEAIGQKKYSLDTQMQKILDDRVIGALDSPELMSKDKLKAMTTLRTPVAGKTVNVKDVVFSPKGLVSRRGFDEISFLLKPEVEMKLAKVRPLTVDEQRFLSGVYLLKKEDQCQSAVGLFHKLAKSRGWEAESNFYISICSKKLGLITDLYERASRVLDSNDEYYSQKILAEISSDVPYEVSERFGAALLKASANKKLIDSLEPLVRAEIAYVLAEYSVSTERFKTALVWAKAVPATHPKSLKARFLLALSEYQAGSKEAALKIQQEIVDDSSTDKTKFEFQALVALNAARMHFQEKDFKEAHEHFKKVYKDHPLWLQSLTELGWAQLLDGDFEGAVGNMYSVHSPFFTSVYKPESFVIRTIGYLNLCQYGDAYKSLSILEHDYRPVLNKMESYIKRSSGQLGYYQTVKNFFAAGKEVREVDSLPVSVVREMARHRDFINLQKALNRQVDERKNYALTDEVVERRLRSAQSAANATRKEIELLRKSLARYQSLKNQKEARLEVQNSLDLAMERLNDNFFFVDLYTDAKSGMAEYRKEVVGGADLRIVQLRERTERVLANRLLRMKVDLSRILENNELLRYEVFAGSGENIRFQVAGGELGKRIPASVLPKSKSLHWDFEGEFWEDEIGNYRSSLRNNCPDRSERAHASLDGGVK